MLATVLSVAVTVTSLDGVADCAPVNWAQNNQGHLGLEIRLIKAGEDAEAVECLELRVQILLLV